MAHRKIKVLIVDDSILFRETLARFLSEGEAVEVVGKAGDPYEARDMILSLRPDVLTLDVEMPKMNGIQFLRKLVPQYPIPSVVVSSAPIMAFEALESGAVDYVKKPMAKTQEDLRNFASELESKIVIASQAKVIKRKNTVFHEKKESKPGDGHSEQKPVARRSKELGKIVALGASTGGTDALQTVLSGFPEDMAPVVIVQHMPPVFTKMFADRLNRICAIRVKEAENGDRLENGLALLAPGETQMRVKKDRDGYYVEVGPGDKVSGHCPSVDVLFFSVAQTAGKNAVGVIMTGMGGDGANGLVAMHEKGAFTIGQDKESCVVYGMPMVAYKMGGCSVQAPLDDISGRILAHL